MRWRQPDRCRRHTSLASGLLLLASTISTAIFFEGEGAYLGWESATVGCGAGTPGIASGPAVDVVDGVAGEVALGAGDPVLLGQVTGIDDLGFGLAGPEDAHEAGVAVHSQPVPQALQPAPQALQPAPRAVETKKQRGVGCIIVCISKEQKKQRLSGRGG